MYRHVLLATDLAESSYHVAEVARQMADLTNAKLSMVYAIEPVLAYGNPSAVSLIEPLVDLARQDASAFGEKWKILPADQYVVFGSVRSQVLQMASELSADLIVIGRHSHSGLFRLLGSSASGIVSHAECDVLTVRHD